MSNKKLTTKSGKLLMDNIHKALTDQGHSIKSISFKEVSDPRIKIVNDVLKTHKFENLQVASMRAGNCPCGRWKPVLDGAGNIIRYDCDC